MSAAGPVFVTPHAVNQFQARIAPLDYPHALAAIIQGISRGLPPRPLLNGTGVYVRSRPPYQFRAHILPPAPGRLLPVCVTVTEGW